MITAITIEELEDFLSEITQEDHPQCLEYHYDREISVVENEGTIPPVVEILSLARKYGLYAIVEVSRGQVSEGITDQGYMFSTIPPAGVGKIEIEPKVMTALVHITFSKEKQYLK